MDKDLITFVNETFKLEIKNISYDELKVILAEKINGWINHDFSKLIHVLYRIDVSEAKINQLLKDNKTSYAADILADLIIERQLEKLNSKREFPTKDLDSDEERW